MTWFHLTLYISCILVIMCITLTTTLRSNSDIISRGLMLAWIANVACVKLFLVGSEAQI